MLRGAAAYFLHLLVSFCFQIFLEKVFVAAVEMIQKMN